MSRMKSAMILSGLMLLSQAVAAVDTTAGAAAQGSVSTAGGLFSVLFGLIAVIAMIVGLAWMARRFGMMQPRDNALIQIVGTASLGARERVAIVQVQDSWIVVGVSNAGVTSLATLPKGNVSLPPGVASPAGFAERLKAMLEAKHAR